MNSLASRPRLTVQEPEASAISEAPWSLSCEDLVGILGTGDKGLDDVEVEKRLLIHGPNEIARAEKASAWQVWCRQFRSLIVALLGAAAVVSALVGDWIEAVAVLVVVLVNALIGFFTEWRALLSMDALKRLTRQSVRVCRSGIETMVPASLLVPGDLVILEAGDIVPADLRLVEANVLQSDESSLTGESIPIEKTIAAVPEDTVLAERTSMLFGGAKISDGNGRGIVTATGLQSELGKISEMLEGVSKDDTPLEKQLARLGHRLIWVTLGMTLLVTLSGILGGKDINLMIQTGIALAVAAIPEGLPIVATIALARGLWRMAERNALINRLSAVETLGATEIICTDKTGTLTENHMTVVAVWGFDAEKSEPLLDEGMSETGKEVLLAAALCNNAALHRESEKHNGDPLEIALLEGARTARIEFESHEGRSTRIAEVPFDPVRRAMATIHLDGIDEIVLVKGAPEAVFASCSEFSGRSDSMENGVWQRWQGRNETMASRGLRVIAVARKTRNGSDDPFSDLHFLGLIGLLDPPRADVADAIADCTRAGIRTIMITGDQAATAEAIAKSIGFPSVSTLQGSEIERMDLDSERDRRRVLEANVIARATPAQKLSLIRLYQKEGKTVAMTGDGVNDAPALKQADIGVAMGLRGTDVARDAAAMILRDDAFSTIVAAIRQGRTIFDNIRKFVVYLISCNSSEILVVGAATFVSTGLPILPLQILFLNLVTDVFPALALGVTKPSGEVLHRRPRPQSEPILRRRDWLAIIWQAGLIAAATLGAFVTAIQVFDQTTTEAITVSFLTLAIAQLLHVFNMKGKDESFFGSSVARNRWVWGALSLCLGLLAAACYVPLLAAVLGLRAPSPTDLVMVFGFAVVPPLAETIRCWVTKTVGKLSPETFRRITNPPSPSDEPR